jgi:exonuclease III
MNETISFLNCFLIEPEFLFRNEQRYRLTRIIPFLNQIKPSIIGLSEIFRAFSSQFKLQVLSHDYKFIYYNDGFIQNSGLMLLYKPTIWKLLTHTKNTFSHFTGIDSIANKGFIFAKMMHIKSNKIINFILTHLNSNSYQSKYIDYIQHKQLQKIKNFIYKNKIHNQPLIIFGDFNINLHNSQNITQLKNLGDIGSPQDHTLNHLSGENPQIIDYIILNPNQPGDTHTKVLNYEKYLLSDHNPIYRKIFL